MVIRMRFLPHAKLGSSGNVVYQLIGLHIRRGLVCRLHRELDLESAFNDADVFRCKSASPLVFLRNTARLRNWRNRLGEEPSRFFVLNRK